MPVSSFMAAMDLPARMSNAPTDAPVPGWLYLDNLILSYTAEHVLGMPRSFDVNRQLSSWNSTSTIYVAGSAPRDHVGKPVTATRGPLQRNHWFRCNCRAGTLAPLMIHSVCTACSRAG